MLVFWKENNKIISKLILYQVGAAILGIALTFTAVSNEKLFLATSILSVIFYLWLLYWGAWEAGGLERIKVDSGRAEMKPWKGFFISLCANLPNFILAIIVIPTDIFKETYGLASVIYSIFGTLARFYQGMYLGIISEILNQNPFSFLIIILPAIAVTTFAYLMGINNRRILEFIKKQK